jgi:hypothetical protein
LIEKGIKKERIITKACPQLQSYIEQNPDGEETEMLISVYLSEALDGINKESQVFISLNCSHFGYSMPLWTKALREAGYSHGEIINPNARMSNTIVSETFKKRFSNPKVSYQVVSKVVLLNSKSMYKFFQNSSPELAKAIDEYTIVPELFNCN